MSGSWELPGHALLVGGGQGIGAALAEQLAPACTSWTRTGGVDAADAASVRAAFDALRAEHGVPYALVHCVGDFCEQPLLETDEATYRAQFASNVDTAFQVLQAIVPAMVEAGRGRVVLFAAAGADPSVADREGRTPLHAAAAAGHAACVATLLGVGAVAGPRDQNSQTAADLALLRGHKRLAGTLIAAAR